MSAAAASGAADGLAPQQQQQQQFQIRQQEKQQQQSAGHFHVDQQRCPDGQAHRHKQQQLTQQSEPQQQQHQEQAPGTRRVAVLECEDAEKWKGYTESLWKSALWEEGDEWTIYKVRQLQSWGWPLFGRCKQQQVATPSYSKGRCIPLITPHHKHAAGDGSASCLLADSLTLRMSALLQLVKHSNSSTSMFE
jgi:hypothetical protein